jgi:hypothetical protein
MDNPVDIISTALFLDTHKRTLAVSTVSVKQFESGGLVLRFAADLGSILHLAFDEIPWMPEMPIITNVKGFKAEKSSGFAEVLYNPGSLKPLAYIETTVVGVCGFPWMHNPSLKHFTEPMPVLVHRSGTFVRRIKTHTNFNSYTAEAAKEGIKLLALRNTQAAYLIEGQSNWTNGWEITASPPELYTKPPFQPQWLSEFQDIYRRNGSSEESHHDDNQPE